MAGERAGRSLGNPVLNRNLGNVAERRTRSLLLGDRRSCRRSRRHRAMAFGRTSPGAGGIAVARRERAPRLQEVRATGRRIPSHAVSRTHRTHRPCRRRAARLVRRLRPIQIGPRPSSPRPVPIQRSEGGGRGSRPQNAILARGARSLARHVCCGMVVAGPDPFARTAAPGVARSPFIARFMAGPLQPRAWHHHHGLSPRPRLSRLASPS